MLTATMVAVPGPTCYPDMLQHQLPPPPPPLSSPHHLSLNHQPQQAMPLPPQQQQQQQSPPQQPQQNIPVSHQMLHNHGQVMAQPPTPSGNGGSGEGELTQSSEPSPQVGLAATASPSAPDDAATTQASAPSDACDTNLAATTNPDAGNHVTEAVHQMSPLQPPMASMQPPPPLIHHQGAPMGGTLQLNHTTMGSTTLTNSTNIPVVTSTIDMAGTHQYSQPPLPPYCPPDFYGGEYYHAGPPPDYHSGPPPDYHPGPPPDYCAAAQHMCPGLHGVPPGPATVRMVSTNSNPPIALPVQVPPGHVVQQIVDENGTLQHVILSSQLPMNVCYHGGNQGQPGPHQFYGPPSHPGNAPPPPQSYIASYQPTPQYSPVMTPPSLTQPSPPPLNYSKQERHTGSGRQFEKPRQKFYSRPQQQQQQQQQSMNPQMQSNYGQQPHRTGSNNICLLNTPPTSPKKEDMKRNREEESAEDGSIESVQLALADLLSQVQPVEVTNITPFSAMLQWQPPPLHLLPSAEQHHLQQQRLPGVSKDQVHQAGGDSSTPHSTYNHAADPQVDHGSVRIPVYSPADITYELLVNGQLVATVPGITNYHLQKLKPGFDYNVQLRCWCGGVRAASPSRETAFTALTTVPEKPSPPRLFNKSKNSLFVKWVLPKDGGARIMSCTLQVTEAAPEVPEQQVVWREVYRGRSRDFTVLNLTPATGYRLRIAAENQNGLSEWSSELVCSTSGVPPPQPAPPILEKATVSSLLLSWPRNLPHERYILKMEDTHNNYGFLVVYRGPDNSYCCTQLRRNTEYKFRLGAESDEGPSPLSEVARYSTSPEPPAAPSPPSIKGRPRSHSLRFSWNPPSDNGGSPIVAYRLLMDKGNGFEVVYEGSACECDCHDLVPGSTYSVRSQALNKGGEGQLSKVTSATTEPVVPLQCPPPSLAAKPKAALLHLKWDPPASDGGSPLIEYNVEMVMPDCERRIVYNGITTNCTVAGLLPGRPYVLLVRAVNRVGPGPWSEPLNVVSGAGPPEAPKSPQLACRSATIVTAHWDEPINNGAKVDSYNIEVAEVSLSHPESSESSSTCGDSEANELTFSLATSSSNNSAEIKHLQPDTSYAVRVCALNCAGAGAFSPHSVVTTPPSAPSAPTHITSTTTCSTISLHWAEPKCNGDPILHYVVELVDTGRSFSTDEPVLEYTIPDCLPDTHYRLRVQAVNGVGVGPASPIHKCQTSSLPPAPPTLELVKASYNSLKVSWGEKKQNLLNNEQLTYCLQMEFPNPQNQCLEFYQVYCGHGSSYRLSRLEEATVYRLRICASSEAGVGPNSEPVEFRTTRAPPVAPKAPRASEQPAEDGSSPKYLIEWCPVRCFSDNPVTYTLQARIATKQLDYTTIYTGSETRHVMSVCPGALYNVRVCAVRQLKDGEGTLAGPYSSPTVFNAPNAVQPVKQQQSSDSVHQRGGTSVAEQLSWQRLTDAKKAALLVTVFSVLAALMAYVLAPPTLPT